MYEKIDESCSRLSMCTPGIEKKLYMCLPAIEFFDTGGHMIRSEHMKSCLSAQMRFMLF